MNTYSLIICCYNSRERLEPTLRAVCAMQVPEGLVWELIIVDNNSSDGTGGFARQLLSELQPPSWKVVEEKEPGLMNARLCGANNAQHDVLAFIDDDNWPDAGWLAEAVATDEANPRIGAWGGWCSPTAKIPLPEWFDRHAGKFACGPMRQAEGICAKPFLRGAGLCIRKKAWQQIQPRLKTPHLQGRTGKSLSSGDDDFICQLLHRHGWPLYYNPRMHMMHEMPAARLTEDYLLLVSAGIGTSKARLRASVLVNSGWPEIAYHPLRLYYKLRALPPYLAARKHLRQHPGDLDARCRHATAQGFFKG